MNPLKVWLVAAVMLSGAAEAEETMTAVRIHQFGGPEVLTPEPAPRPVPGAGELLVRVVAAGVNPVDAIVRAGHGGWLFQAQFPHVPGYDLSGVVAAVGDRVTQFAVGDEVFAMLDLRRAGAYAEYAIVREAEAAAKPGGISHAEAASLPLVALTAWQALFETANLQRGQTVLIHGGAGGVGSVAIQLAKWRGARVVATASARNLEFLRELGVDEAIDYTSQRFEEVISDVDVVLDPIGGQTQARSFTAMRDGGVLVTLVGLGPAARNAGRGIRAAEILVEPDADQLARIAALVEAGDLRPIVTHRMPLAEAADAHRQSETRRTRGKIVLEVVADWRAEVDALVDEVVTTGEVVGVSAVVLKHGRPVHSVVRGVADLESMSPVSAQTRFHIGSITKVFTAAAVMELVERGLIDLDDDIRHHVPEIGAEGPRITYRHLLSHTSGLVGPQEVLAKFAERRHLEFSRAQLLALVEGEPRVAEPGTRYAYNNIGYLILGIVVERVTGTTFDEHLRGTVLTGAGASSVRLCTTQDVVPHRARGYAVRGGVPLHHEPVNASLVFAAGGLCGVTSEVALWFHALVSGEVVAQSAFEAMATQTRLEDGSAAPYGMGLFIDGHRVHHGGDVNGYSGHAAHYVDKDLTVVVLSNTRGSAARRLESHIAAVACGQHVLDCGREQVRPGFQPHRL